MIAIREMLKKLLLQSSILLSAVVASAQISTPAQAFQVFFGQDPGLSKDTRLLSHADADAARDRFLSNLADVQTEDFENFNPGCNKDLSINLQNSAIVALQGRGCIFNHPTGTNGVGRYPISGNQYWETENNFSITFPQPITALGFYGVDIGDFFGELTLTLQTLSAATTLTIPNQLNCLDSSVSCMDGSVIYYGAIAQTPSEAFTSVIFTNIGQAGDFFEIDNLSIGWLNQVQPKAKSQLKQIQPLAEPVAIPEPISGLSLLVFAVLGIRLRVLRHRK